MQYAINEGFVVVYYWVADDGMELKGVAYATPAAHGSLRQIGDDNAIFTVFGKDYEMNDDFYLDYGIQVDSKHDAEAEGRKWVSQWIGTLRQLRKELPQAIC
jgi:hypothetical protein